MTRRAPSGLDRGPDPLLEHGPGREQQCRVEVALDGSLRPDPPARLVQRHPEVDPDHIGPSLPEVGEQLTGPDAEVDLRNPREGSADVLQDRS